MKKTIKFADDLIEKEEDGQVQSRSIVPSQRHVKPQNQVAHEAGVDISPSEIINVDVRLVILKLSEISTKQGRFSCEIFMEASWYDKHLMSGELTEEADIGYYDEKKNWNPLLYVQNIVNHQSQEKWYSMEKTAIGYMISNTIYTNVSILKINLF